MSKLDALTLTLATSPTREASRATARPSRFVKYIVERGWLHVVLITFVCLFLFPFAWMAATSLKTDEEVTSDDWLPSMPTFRGDSPYVRKTPSVEKPLEIQQSQWDSLLPRLRAVARQTVASAKFPTGGSLVDEAAYRESAAELLVSRLVGKLNTELFSDADKAIAGFKKLLTPEAVTEAMNDQFIGLELRGLQVRTLNAHITRINSPWKIESGDASLIDSDAGALLRYHFKSSTDDPIILRCDFDFPAEPKELHKLIVSLKPDDSWHQLVATFDLAGDRWVPIRTSYLGASRAQSIIFQPPTFDDTTDRKRIWIPLKKQGEVATPSGLENRATLRLIIKPSSTFWAIYGKVVRNYVRVFDSVPFWRYVGNSIWLVAFITLGTLFSASFVAYAFARLNWPGRTVAFGILLATMMLPGQVTMIPSFMIWRTLGWYNTLAPMWVPAWFGGAFFIFLMTQTMKTIPRELEEAARLDGLNALRTWWHIILPQTKPTLAAIAIMTFMGAWNEFMGPLIYLRDQAKFPLSLGLFGIRLENMTDWSMLMAANILMTLPVIIIFFLFQRYFIQGLTMSGMKG